MIIALALAFGVFLVAGLVIIPAIEESRARSSTALSRYKGQQGDSSSGGKRHGSHV